MRVRHVIAGALLLAIAGCGDADRAPAPVAGSDEGRTTLVPTPPPLGGTTTAPATNATPGTTMPALEPTAGTPDSAPVADSMDLAGEADRDVIVELGVDEGESPDEVVELLVDSYTGPGLITATQFGSTITVEIDGVPGDQVAEVAGWFELEEVELSPVLECVAAPGSIDGATRIAASATEVCSLGVAIDDVDLFPRHGAAMGIDAATQRWGVAVALSTSPAARATFDAAVAECYTKAASCPTGRLAVVVGGRLVAAPMVMSPNFGDSLTVSGDFTEMEVRDLAKAFNRNWFELPWRVIDVTVEIH